MEAVKLVRLDYRLIHGQVITKWNNKVQATEIIIIDDMLTKDSFMMDIYTMAAPPGIKVSVITEDEFIERNINNKLNNGNILVLLKNVKTLKDLVDKDLIFKEVQIGGLGGGKNSKQIVTGITITPEDLKLLKYVFEKGVDIYFQVTPEENKVHFNKIS